MNAVWDIVRAELARTADQGGVTRFWLRDDDAIDVTPALDRLAALCRPAGMPLLLAVIPAGATVGLATWCADRSFVTPCQHGWAHTNRAAAGERACELGGDRDDEDVTADLRRGRAAMQALFGDTLAPILVPPWNRIRETVATRLPALGFTALSTFGPETRRIDGLAEINCDIDNIDWRNGRRGRSIDDLGRRLAAAIAQARVDGRPIGLLTHHLAHDTGAWSFLEDFFNAMGDSPSVRYIGATDVLA